MPQSTTRRKTRQEQIPVRSRSNIYRIKNASTNLEVYLNFIFVFTRGMCCPPSVCIIYVCLIEFVAYNTKVPTTP